MQSLDNNQQIAICKFVCILQNTKITKVLLEGDLRSPFIIQLSN